MTYKIKACLTTFRISKQLNTKSNCVARDNGYTSTTVNLYGHYGPTYISIVASTRCSYTSYDVNIALQYFL